jgi:hypothetical protein
MKKEIKLTDDETSELQKLNADYQTLVFQIGDLSLKKNQLETELGTLNVDQTKMMSTFESMKGKELNFMERLESKYGAGRLDASSGNYINY